MDAKRVKALAEHVAGMSEPLIVYGPEVTPDAVSRLWTEMSTYAELPDDVEAQPHPYLRSGDLLVVDRATLYPSPFAGD